MGRRARTLFPPRPTGPTRPPRLDRQFRSNDRADAGDARGLVKARRAVHAVAIEQCERGIAERRRAIDERFGKRRALEKAEGGGGVEFDVMRRHDRPSWSINDGIDEPPLGVAILKNPVHRAVAERDVPFVAIPVAVAAFLTFSRGTFFTRMGPHPHAFGLKAVPAR